MLNLRPHRLWWRSAVRGYTDAQGFYHEGAERWQGDIPCHARPAGRANEISYADGTTRRYSYSVYLDSTAPNIELGTRVRLRLSDGSEREYEVLGWFRYQTHCKLWL